MSNRVENPSKKPNAPPPAPKPGVAPARKRVSSTPLADRPQKARRDWWPWNLMGVLVAIILGTGLLVWTLRTTMGAASTATPEPTATALAAAPTQPPAEGSPVVGALPSPTLSAPDALGSGPYAAVDQIDSTVGNTDNQRTRPVLPPSVPAPHLAFSEEGHDWGQITASGTVSTVITVANPGNRTLKVDQLLSNCSCLSGNMSAKTLAVGNRATLVVQYDPAQDGKKGTIERTLTILSDAGDTPVKTLTFKAIIP